MLVVFLAAGAALLLWFFIHVRSRQRGGKEPLLSTTLFNNRTSNLGLVTQNIQWLLLMGITFVVSVFLQEERGFSAIKTGVIFLIARIARMQQRQAFALGLLLSQGGEFGFVLFNQATAARLIHPAVSSLLGASSGVSRKTGPNATSNSVAIRLVPSSKMPNCESREQPSGGRRNSSDSRGGFAPGALEIARPKSLMRRRSSRRVLAAWLRLAAASAEARPAMSMHHLASRRSMCVG